MINPVAEYITAAEEETPPPGYNAPSVPDKAPLEQPEVTGTQCPASTGQYPAPGYGPQKLYGAPQQPYGAPQQPYGPSQQPYGAPQQAYGAPQQPYGAPQQPYGAPQQPYGAPQQPYGAPQQQYGAPQMYCPQQPVTSQQQQSSNNVVVVQMGGNQATNTYVTPPMDYTTQAWLVCLFCFWPLGIVAIIKAYQARDAFARGDVDESFSAARQAQRFVRASLASGILDFIIIIIIIATTR